MRRLLMPASALFWGLQYSLVFPSLALLLSSLYGADASRIGTVLMVYNTAGFVFSLVIPVWADRRGEYLTPLVGCAVLTIALAVALALAPGLPAAVVALLALGAPAGVGSTLFFAHLRHSGMSSSQMMDTRAVLSFAWVIGMPLATTIGAHFGARSILLLIGAVAVLNVALTLVVRSQHRRTMLAAEAAPDDAQTDQGEPKTAPTRASMLLLALMVAVFVLLQATNVAAVSVTPLLVEQTLELRLFWAGLALGLAAAFEVPALVLLGRLSGRIPDLVLIGTGALAAVAYYAAITFATRPWQLLALQLPNAWFIAVVSGVGLTWFQGAIDRPGLASGLFGNTRMVGSILAGPLVALGAATSMGYAGVFAAAAAVSVLALLLLGAAAMAGRRPVAPREA